MADKRKKPNVVDQATRTAKLAVKDPSEFVKGAASLPGTLAKGVVSYAQTHTPQQFGADVVRTGKNIASDIVEHPVQTVAGALPIIGSAMSGYDAAKAREAAADARARGDEKAARLYEQIAAASGATILAGMIPGGRTVAKGVAKEGEQAAVKEAERLAAKYGLPEFTTDLTPAQIEANKAAFLEGAKSPPVLYHGTTQWEGDAYNPNRATVNRTGNNIAGFYADERPKRAESYALDWRTNDTEFGEGANVMPVHMAIKNPFVPGKTPVSKAMLDAYATELRASNRHLGSSGEDWVANKVRDAAQANHFSIGALNGDGMAYQRVVRAGGYDGLKDGTAWVAFEPTQIKSTMNRGTFDPNEPHLNKAMGGLVKKYGV